MCVLNLGIPCTVSNGIVVSAGGDMAVNAAMSQPKLTFLKESTDFFDIGDYDFDITDYEPGVNCYEDIKFEVEQ